MLPTLTIFGIEIGTYSICVIAGIIFASLYVGIVYKVRRNPAINSVQTVNIPIVAGIGAFIGAHILYGLTHLDHIWWVLTHLSAVFESFDSVIAYFADIFGGMVFYGGLIGGIIAGLIYMKHMKLDSMMYADLYAPAIPLFHAFGRIGCFLGGCCYGIESSWGFTYTIAPTDSNGVVRLPIQLIESAGDILIFIILAVLSSKKLRKGMLMYLYLILYPILRFTTEFFRGDEIRGFFLWFSTSQWISIILFTISCICIFRLYKRDGTKSKQNPNESHDFTAVQN